MKIRKRTFGNGVLRVLRKRIACRFFVFYSCFLSFCEKSSVVFCKKCTVLFTLAFFTFIFSSCKADKGVVEENSLMSEQSVEKFTITEVQKGKLKMVLEAESAVINESINIAHLERPVLKFYDKDGYASTLIAESADISMLTYDVRCKGRCTIDSANNEHLLTTDLMYNAEKGSVYSNNNVKIIKQGETIYGKSFEADIKLDKIVVKNQRIVLD